MLACCVKFTIIGDESAVFTVSAGDMTDDEKVLSWLTSQDVLEIKDEIEEVNRKMLDKLLDENDFVAVYFCECNTAQVLRYSAIVSAT